MKEFNNALFYLASIFDNTSTRVPSSEELLFNHAGRMVVNTIRSLALEHFQTRHKTTRQERFFTTLDASKTGNLNTFDMRWLSIPAVCSFINTLGASSQQQNFWDAYQKLSEFIVMDDLSCDWRGFYV